MAKVLRFGQDLRNLALSVITISIATVALPFLGIHSSGNHTAGRLVQQENVPQLLLSPR